MAKAMLPFGKTTLQGKCPGPEERANRMPMQAEFEGIVASTPAMRAVIHRIIEAAGEEIPVLITGEIGTGKSLVAAAIHKRSRRENRPYVPVNLAAIPSEFVASELWGHEREAQTEDSESRPGVFEQAREGTLFLDEITSMDKRAQVTLLRVFETKTIRRIRGDRDIPVDVRVIAATSDNIEQAARNLRFREDLYYRLDVFRIQLPSLREQDRAIPMLAHHFMTHSARLYRKDVRTVSYETHRLMRCYPWPGNVRELKNVIQQAVMLARRTELTPNLLPQRIRNAETLRAAQRTQLDELRLGMSLAEVEKEYIRATLVSVNRNKQKAASLLGISRRTLYNKLTQFGMLRS